VKLPEVVGCLHPTHAKSLDLRLSTLEPLNSGTMCRITRPSPRPLAGPEVVGTPGDANDVSRPGSDRWRCRCRVGS